jgi:AcrR family transcriptional regulator/DNA-binding PadR family transcriptional regulator
MASSNGHLRMRNPAPGPHGGGLYVSELQRVRLLDATFAVVYEQGYRGMAVRAVAERAGVSSKTFYDLFSDREDCFLAAFDHGVEELRARARPVFEGGRDWTARIHGGLGVMLEVLESEPALRRLVFVEALGAGPRVLARRAEVLEQLAGVVDEGRVGMKAPGGLPPLTAEGVVGGAFGVIHARLSQQPSESLIELLNPLMAMIVRPYRGSTAATRELARPAMPSGAQAIEDRPVPRIGTLNPVDFRLTVRSQSVLAVVAEYPGLSNQRVSEFAGISDQGQISRLMIRLQEQGLVENIREQTHQGHAKAWRLTAEGEDVVQANPPLRSEQRGTRTFSSGRKSPAGVKSPARLAEGRTAAPISARGVTDRTRLVLTAVAELGTRDFAPSNRQVSRAAGVRDQGQISKLLGRLEQQGLVHNSGGQTQGIPNAWRLTPSGEEVLSASRSTPRGTKQ